MNTFSEEHAPHADPAGLESNLDDAHLEHLIETDLPAASEHIKTKLQATIEEAHLGANDIKSQAHEMFPSSDISFLDTSLDGGIDVASEVLMSTVDKVY